jgi:septum formation inhibitor MinC
MYFRQPEQLLGIFAQLEERNLFLIQNVQETEEALEELKQKFGDTSDQMEEKTSQLQTNITDLKGKISVENEKAEHLRRRSRANTIAGNQQKLLQGLSDKVKEVYAKCGFPDADTQTDTLDMLREIEGWLEYLLSEIKRMDPAKVAEAEKKKETERRNRVRKAKKEEQKRQYEERLAKSTARAKAEVIKRTGKQVMFRSPPLRRKKVKEDKVETDDEAEEIRKFFN